MPNNNHAPPKTERERRMRWVQMQRVAAGEIDTPGTRYPTTPEQRAAARKRVCEVLALQAGLPLPDWDRLKRGKAELIDERPWAAGRAVSARMQYERLGKFGLAFARDGSIRCVKCKEVVLALPRTGALAIGTTGSALATRHAQATGCR